MEYSHVVGKRLRKIRIQNKYSLKEVEKITKGDIKASILGAYERGERVISVPRLFELADFFKVPVDYLLRDGEATAKVKVKAHPAARESIRINLMSLSKTKNNDAQPIKSYINSIKKQREDFNLEVITIRDEDLRMLAAMYKTSPTSISKKLEKLDIIAH
jgi:transcriptional regulator with XRE-family HTH domain